MWYTCGMPWGCRWKRGLSKGAPNPWTLPRRGFEGERDLNFNSVTYSHTPSRDSHGPLRGNTRRQVTRHSHTTNVTLQQHQQWQGECTDTSCLSTPSASALYIYLTQKWKLSEYIPATSLSLSHSSAHSKPSPHRRYKRLMVSETRFFFFCNTSKLDFSLMLIHDK